jgi:hypothetical protein
VAKPSWNGILKPEVDLFDQQIDGEQRLHGPISVARIAASSPMPRRRSGGWHRALRPLARRIILMKSNSLLIG